MKGIENGDQDQRFRQCMFEVFKVGVGCSVELAKERMRISDAVSKLKSIRDDLLRERMEMGDDNNYSD